MKDGTEKMKELNTGSTFVKSLRYTPETSVIYQTRSKMKL